jgi:hypothetical protein
MENNDHNVLYIYLVGGLEHDWIIYHILEIIIPNWRSPSFFRGLGWSHQPDNVKILGVTGVTYFHRKSGEFRFERYFDASLAYGLWVWEF